MNPETQAEKPLGGGNSQSGPSKSPPPLPAKNRDLPLLPSAMMFQKVLEKNNFAIVAGVILVGFSVCMVGIMVFVGVFLKDKKPQGNQADNAALDKIRADEKDALDKIRDEDNQNTLFAEKKERMMN